MRLRAFITTLLLSVLAQAAQAQSPAGWSDVGAMAAAQYRGDGLAVSATSEGADLRAAFQKLTGRVSSDGLWLSSTERGGGPDVLHVIARGVGRTLGGDRADESPVFELAATGLVTVEGARARFVRPHLVEEFAVSVDGVRQDFVLIDRPAGDGALRADLAIAGADAAAAEYGVRLTLGSSGREIAYARLHVTDALGRVLSARFEVPSPTRIAVVVDDTDAEYPVRIDPTFSDADWVSMGSVPFSGNNSNAVKVTVVDAAGNLYVGGDFKVIDSVLVKNIARWDGSAWSALGSGLDQSVVALAVSGTDVYAAGQFSTAGGTPANGVAKWNGTTWSALGSGVSGVLAIAAPGADVYVGGQFTTAGGVSAVNVAKWSGGAWSALGAGVGNRITAMAATGSDLYVGGTFTTAGGSPASRVARWTFATSSWSPLGSGVANTVNALAVSGADLYVGGTFSTAGGSPASRIAKWTSATSQWSALQTGVNSTVTALAVSGANLYVGGQFTLAGGITANRLAKWDGAAWSDLAMEPDTNMINALAASGADVYVGGGFTTAGGITAYRIAKFNTGTWSALGSTTYSGVNAEVRALHVVGSDLYVGGDFTHIGGVPISYVAKWDGRAWSALGAGLDGQVFSMASSGTDLYVGGAFSTAGDTPAQNVAKWDGSAWSALGSGIHVAVVYALAVMGTDLYASADTNVEKWDGTEWSAVGGSGNGSISALAVSGTDLYAGGQFTNRGGAAASNIAKWDGGAWLALGTGVNGGVFALTVSGADVYAGGGFTTAGGVTVNGIAKWDGAWSALGSGLEGQVEAIAVSGTDVYAGGFVFTGASVLGHRIAKWDGTTWSPLGSGVNSTVDALAVSGSDLYVGGALTVAGDKASAFLARGLLDGAPEIAVDQPIGTAIVDGGSRTFGSVNLGTTSSLTFTVSNMGDADLSGLIATIDGPDAARFGHSMLPALIPAGGSSALVVQFTPAGFAPRSAILHIASNDADESSFDINLTGTGVDTTPPAIAGTPAKMLVPAATASGAVVTFTAPTATDTVDGPVPVTCGPVSGSVFPIATTTVTCSATDAHGNTAQESFSVTVRDATPPVLTRLTATPGTLSPSNHSMVPVTVTAFVGDVVDPHPACSIRSIMSSEADSGLMPTDLPNDIVITGPMTANLRAEAKSQRTYRVSVSCTDAAGNVSAILVLGIVAPHSPN